MWFRKHRDRDFAEEIEAHIRLEADRLIEEGMTEAEADVTARRTFGNVTLVRERFYESRRWTWFDQLRQDVRYGFRSLWKARAFAIAAAATIALGTGANTAVFSLADAVLLRSLPVEKPQDLVFLNAAGTEGGSGPPAYPYFSRLRQETRTCEQLAAFASDEMRIEIGGRPEQVMGQVASGNYFDLLGVRPMLGRVMTPEDEALDPPVAVISERFWRRRFGGDPAVIGKTLTQGKRTFVVVGVTPPEFFGLQPGSAVDITIPITTQEKLLTDSSSLWLQGIVARRKPGVSPAQVQAEADVLYRSFMADSRYPRDVVTKYFQRVEAEPAAQGLDVIRSRYSQPLHVLMMIAALVLLLVVANVANLLLSRGTSRSREFAIRIAAGASRARIARQLLTETVLLFAVGALPGMVLARWGVAAIESMFREGRRAIELDASLNGRVLAFSIAITFAAGVAAGLFPAWRAFRRDPDQALKEGHPRAGETRSSGGLAQALVALQVAVSLVLLVGAGFFSITLRSLGKVDTGYRGEGVLTMSIQSPPGYASAKATALWTHAVEAVRQIPGVRSAGVSTYTPLSGRDRGAIVRVRGYIPASDEDATVHTNQVSEGYFESMGIALVRGRVLTDGDAEDSVKVALINESTAKEYFGDRDPLGEILNFTRTGGDRSYRIAGVVRDTKHMNLREEPQRFVYVPMRQPRDVDSRVTLVIAAAVPGAEMNLLAPVRSTLAKVEPGMLISDVISMQSQMKTTLMTERLLAGLSEVSGGLAMTLAAIGLYGVLSYRVGRQRRAIAIRMALGASRSTVVAGVLRQSGLAVSAGLLAGLPVAVIAARYAANLIWGVKADDFRVHAAGSFVLGVVALLSACIPARRAASVSPVDALRES